MAKILIAEDSGFQRTIIKRIITRLGHEAVEAKTGREALRQIEDEQPDLILLDMLMPDIDGLQVLKVLKSKHLQTPVIVITADVQETTRKRCEEAGVREIIYKPVDEDKLSSALKKVLE
ncbi:MAG: response regulator [Desulfonatronovibrio sp. MSAO_Bac4]|nr:MAG: response regulator [Desulfonatronovibrio sp. MSAO_Bac4]